MPIHYKEESCAGLRLLDGAIEALREIAGPGVCEIQQVVKGVVGAEGSPVRQVGAALKDVILPGSSGELDLKHPIGISPSGCEINRRGIGGRVKLALREDGLCRGRTAPGKHRAGETGVLVIFQPDEIKAIGGEG